MCAVYRASSSARVEQMEAELARQLSALRGEEEENGPTRGSEPSRSYSSVPPPKDVSSFRAEREHALRRALQVSGAVPVLYQADVVRRELESCLGPEHTPDSLAPLLLQFFADRTYHLSRMKYLLMLRWRRFCHHTSVIERLYPHYKDQVSYLTSEYEDAFQRGRRLSAGRERILSGRGNPAGLLAEGDAVIYLRWLVCHLHSVQNIHSFLRVLHYLPAGERKDEELQPGVPKQTSSQQPQRVDGPPGAVPLHPAHLEEFLPELESLVALFRLPCDVGGLRTAADEMELFSTVWREFRSVFTQQEQMKTFPQCDGTGVDQSHWGRTSGSMAVRVEAGWIPHIQVKPKPDPWQQKLTVKLRQRSVDELLQLHCRFTQVPDLTRVAVALREHAGQVCSPQAAPTASKSSGGRTNAQSVFEFWTRIYDGEPREQASRSRGGQSKRTTKSPASHATDPSFSLGDRLHPLGLGDGSEEGTSDPAATSGAYLSLIHLRHLRLRQLQRVALGMLNYLRSVERTLTFDLAGLQRQEQELCSSAEETGWMNAARGGRGEAGGLGSMQHSHYTPVDYRVRCSEFMEFSEVENLHDFYSSEQQCIHTQDHRGFYIVYDAALRDLEELENELLHVGSHFIQRHRMKTAGKPESVPPTADLQTWAGADIDRVAVLLDLWTCETEFLESKVQLLNCYYEAYQHTTGAEEMFALARVLTDIMHSRPQLDLNQDYFVQAYRAEIFCLQSHERLIKNVLDNQIDEQRRYLQRIWRDDHKGSIQDYGLLPNYVPKHLVSLGGSSPALQSVFLLELHPSLCMASAVYDGLVQAHWELCQLRQTTSVSERLLLRQRLLQQALHAWSSLASPGSSYSVQIQKDLFSDQFFEDPILVQKVGLMLARSAEEKGVKQEGEDQWCPVRTFSKLLELVTIRHRLLESASETAHLAQLYRNVASELGFGDFHLYLRPVQFEAAEQKNPTEQSLFITAVVEDDSSVDRFTPTQLPLGIQELDDNQIGTFSFSSEDAVIQLMNNQSIENLQVTLACQVAQKNALIGAVKLASLCYWAQNVASSKESRDLLYSDKDVKSPASFHSKHEQQDNASHPKTSKTSPTTKERLSEAFVSIQLEKVGVRDEMLNSFMKKKRAMGGLLKTPEEAAKIKRELIVDFLKKFSIRMSQYCVRAQIVAYCYSLTSLLDHVPSVRQSHFVIGQATEPTGKLDLEADLCPNPRTFRGRPRRFVSEDGRALLNLWFIPHFSEVLHMFKTQDVLVCAKGLHHTLQIVSGLHDIVYYLVSFSKLGNTENWWSCRSGRDAPCSQLYLSANWGGSEGIGAELLEIQRQVYNLSDPSSLECVGRLLQLRRQVLFLQFDTAVRHLIREAFLSSGDFASHQSVSDNMATALPLLSDSIRTNAFCLTLPVPGPLEMQSYQAQMMFPWRSFISCHGLHPLHVWDLPPTEDCMQLCLSGLSDRSRLQANGAILSVSLLLEDVLNSGKDAGPVCLHGNKDALLHDGKPIKGEKSCTEPLNVDEKPSVSNSATSLQDPVRVQSVLKGFLLLTKQLQVFKENWARRRLGVKVFTVPELYQEFMKLYRAEVFLPSMKALARLMGNEHDYEILLSGSQSLLPPPGASDIDVKVFQLHKLLESTECDMIQEVQRRISRELTLVVSERTRQDLTHLPTELWKKNPLKYSLSLEQPQIVETFIQQLMDGAEEAEGQVRICIDHLQQCLTQLGSFVMERERRCFLLYSQFYEQILQQETQLLHQKEQDLKNLKDSQTHGSHEEVPRLCRGMMLEISALRAMVAQLEEEKSSTEEQLSLKYKERYDPLVRQLFSTCVQMKGRFDEYHRQMKQDVSAMVNGIRAEGVDRIIQLKKNNGCTKNTDGLALTQLKKEEVHELSLENSRLIALICKMKALRRWRQVVQEGKLHRQLLQTQQREITSRTEAIRVRMMSEEKVVFLQEELGVARQTLARYQAECNSIKSLLSRKTEELQVVRHQSAQEARRRQELDSYRMQSLEKMRADVEDRDRQLRALSEQLDRDSRMNQLQRQCSAKEIRQVRGQLHQERCLKQEAFQEVDKLKIHVNDMEAAFSRCTTSAGQSRTSYTTPVSRLSTRSPSAGLHRASRQQSALQLGSNTTYTACQELATEPRHQRAQTARSRSNTRLDRPKADSSRLRVLPPETLLPNLCDETRVIILQ